MLSGAATDEEVGELVIRARPGTVAIVVATAGFLALLFVGGGIAVGVHGKNPIAIWSGAVAAWALGSATTLRLKTRFDKEGIFVQNAFRSYSARWDEIVRLRIVPAVWNSSDFAWAANMLEIQTRDGRRIVPRVATHLTRRQAETLTVFLSRRARLHGFKAPSSLLPLWRVNQSAEQGSA